MKRKSPYPKDPNQLAKMIVDRLTIDKNQESNRKEKDPKMKQKNSGSTINESIASSQKSTDRKAPRRRQ